MRTIPDLSSRVLHAELMDDLGLEEEKLHEALQELSHLNSLCCTASQFTREIVQFAASQGLSSLSILDLGCGDGSLLRTIHQDCRRKSLAVTGLGLDFNPLSIKRANELHANADITFRVCDVINDPLPDGFTIVLSNLFFHHFDNTTTKQLLRKIAAIQPRLFLMSDLVRSKLGFALAKAAISLTCRSEIVRADGPWSVQAAHLPEEFLTIALQSGLVGSTVRKAFPERFVFRWAGNTEMACNTDMASNTEIACNAEIDCSVSSSV